MAGRALRIPTSKIYISETSTNTVPNSSPTAASVSSDIYGQAVYVRSCGVAELGASPRLLAWRVPGGWGSWAGFLQALGCGHASGSLRQENTKITEGPKDQSPFYPSQEG